MMQKDNFATNIGHYGARVEWAFWFNVGVQMFLFISGYLYGRKRINIVNFYKKSFSKILVDYYLFVIVMLIIIRFSPLMDIDSNGVIGLLTFSSTVAGLGHLWYIPVILCCYILTPIFLELMNFIDQRSDIRFWIDSMALLIAIHIVTKRFLAFFNPAWINCFVRGIIYNRIEQRKIINKRFFYVIVLMLCLLIIPIQFRIDYWPHEELPLFFAHRYVYFTSYGHVFLGVLIVVLIRFGYNKINCAKNKSLILDWSDKYSYDVYLVHHIFVQSPFACVEFISNRLIALPLAIVFSIVTSIILWGGANYIRRNLVKIYQKLPN